jgi:hypothetical protein
VVWLLDDLGGASDPTVLTERVPLDRKKVFVLEKMGGDIVVLFAEPRLVRPVNAIASVRGKRCANDRAWYSASHLFSNLPPTH